MKKRKILATSSIAVALFLSSYASAQAAHTSFPKPQIYIETQNLAPTEVEISNLSVAAGDLQEDLAGDQIILDTLIDQGFNSSQIKKILAGAGTKRHFYD